VNARLPTNDEPFLRDGGEAGALMRSIDWSQTAMGPAATWPSELKTVISVMLASRFAMRVLWGPDLIFLYNDAYRPILGAKKHPGAMGKRTEDSFPEVWDRVGPMFRRVMAGEAVALTDALLPLDRNGFLEDCYFTLSYSPIRREDGAVGGVLGVVAETTERTVAERRLEALRLLAEGTSGAETSEQVTAAVKEALLRAASDLPFALVYLSDPSDDGSARLVCRVGLPEDTALAPEKIGCSIDEPNSAWPLAEALRTRGGASLELTSKFGEVRVGTLEEPVKRAIVLPLARHFATPHGYLIAGVNPRSAFDDRYRSFLAMTGEQIAAAFSRVRVLEEERRRADAVLAEAQRALLFGQVGVALTRDAPLAAQLRDCCDAMVEHLDAELARVWLLDPSGKWLERAASAGPSPELDGSAVRIAIGESDIGRIASERQPLSSQELTSNGAGGFVEVSGQPLVVNDKLVGVVALFARRGFGADVATTLSSVASSCAIGVERKRAEAERETLIGQLARSNAELDQFAYVASHDLKAPLRGIANLSQWMEEDLSESMTDESREQMRLLRGRVHRLEGLIDGILSYSRAGRVRAQAEAVDTGALVDEVLELLAPGEEVTIEVQRPLPHVTAERVPLEQVFMNLIGNALKYAKGEHTKVRIAAEDVGHAFRFLVTDNGPGIAPEFHARIWGLFQTLEARDKVEGSGVGLSVVKKIVETRGGQVSIESTEGAGATFAFTWPK
jgi:signal transduction histidine kinase